MSYASSADKKSPKRQKIDNVKKNPAEYYLKNKRAIKEKSINKIDIKTCHKKKRQD